MEIYLDNAATTKPCEAAVNAACDCMRSNYGNPSSLHSKGLSAQLIVDDARKTIAKEVACDPTGVYFTSGATESNNLAVIGAAEAYGKRKPKIITSSIEHASVSAAMDCLEKRGFEIVRISPDPNGEFHHEDFVNAVDDRTCLMSIMAVNNETGYIMPVRRAFYGAKKKNPDIITHCDAVQAFMKKPVKMTELCTDLMSLSGHKVHGGKGVGALCVKKGVRLIPRMYGGKQEHGMRSGTENVPMIASFGAAVKYLRGTMDKRWEQVSELKQFLLERLKFVDGVTINSKSSASPYIINISAEGIRSEIMLHFLEQKNIYVSSGSACSKGVQSGVLSQFGISESLADSAIRVSLCADNVMYDLKEFALALAEGKERLYGTRRL